METRVKTALELDLLHTKLIQGTLFGNTIQVMDLLGTLDNQEDPLLMSQQVVLHTASQYGQSTLLEVLFEKYPSIDINKKFNNTALYAAIEECHIDVVKFLLSRAETDLGIRNGSTNKWTILDIARIARYGLPEFESRRKEILSLLRTPEIGARSVQNCLAKKDVQGAVQMLYHIYDNEGWHDNITDGIERLRTCFKLVGDSISPHEHQILCEELLNRIITYTAKRKTEDENKLITDLLVWSRISINQMLKNTENSVLHHAVSAGNLNLLIDLFKCFPLIDVNIRNGDGKTPIFYCDCEEENGVEILKYLLSKNADPAVVIKSGFTPLMDAVIYRQDYTYVQALIHSKENLKANQVEPLGGYTAFTWAAEKLDLKMITLLFQINEVDVNARLISESNQGQTALHYAVQADHKEMIDLLLSRDDINVNILDYRGFSPIFYSRSTRILTALLNKGASASIISKLNHATPLMSMISSLDLVKILIQSRQDLNINQLAIQEKHSHDIVSFTALVLAAWSPDQEIMALVLSIDNINVNIKDAQGKTALHHAVENSRLEHVRLLLTRHEIEFEAADANNMTALAIANDITSDRSVCSNNIYDVIELLERFKNSFDLAKNSMQKNDIRTAASILFDFCDGNKNLSIVLNHHLFYLKKICHSAYPKLVLQLTEIAAEKGEQRLAARFLSLNNEKAYMSKSPVLSPLQQHSKFSSNQTHTLSPSLEKKTATKQTRRFTI